VLTRLEVDGFKNLLGLRVDLGAFTCIAGVNGTGKSNVFDAIQFLSLLANRSLLDAAQEVRGVRGERWETRAISSGTATRRVRTG
jgi:AAA15 family ATPase/GTPase